MKIEIRETKHIFDALAKGVVFQYSRSLYMTIEPTGDCNAINLENGLTTAFGPYDVVKRADCKLVVNGFN